MKKFIQKQLAKKVRKLVARHKPLVIGVTGSVGKTSARNAIATILSKSFDVAPVIKNYNNEFGLPLTILGRTSPGKSLFGWLLILWSIPKSLPKVFVLEYAVDSPGDMAYLCDIVSPSIAVMTTISPVHAENFASIEALAEEKARLLSCVSQDGLCVLNGDDPRVMGLFKHCEGAVQTYGFSDGVDVRATDYRVSTHEDFSFKPGDRFCETTFTVRQGSDMLEIILVNMLGKATASAILPAVTIAKYLGMTDDQILSALPNIKLEPGRMNPIAGIKGSLILDSSYNAAPASMIAALETLREFHPVENARRIAVLGTMAELGRYSDDEHRQVGMRAAEVADIVVTVGEPTLGIRRGAVEAGMKEEKTQHFKDAVDAGRWLDAHVKKGDVVLVKGSRSVGMEHAVRDIMAEPLDSEHLLCST